MRAARGGVRPNRPRALSRVRFLSLHHHDDDDPFHVLRSSSFRRTFIYSLRVSSSRYYYSHPNKQRTPSSSSSPFVRSFVQRERERREEAKHDDTHKQTIKKSLCALRSQFRSRESKTRFIFVFFCLGFLYRQEKSTKTRIFFPHRGEKYLVTPLSVSSYSALANTRNK